MNHEIFNSHYCEMFRWFLIQMVSYQNACPCLVFVSHTLFPLSWSTQMISLERMEDALLNPCLILTSSVMSENTSRLGDLSFSISMGTIGLSFVTVVNVGWYVCQGSAILETLSKNQDLSLSFSLFFIRESPRCPSLGVRLSVRTSGITNKILCAHVYFLGEKLLQV